MTPLDFLEVSFAILLNCGGVLVLAIGARSWSQAVSAAHTARAHGIQADETQETLQQARHAVMDAVAPHDDNYQRPTDEDLMWGARMSSNSEAGLDPEYNTAGAADLPDEMQSHMSGGEYAT